MTDQRLLLVHAHPDDESSQSVATMARYLDQGAHVTLVTCTLGEMGEILVPDWSHYSPQELGQHRKAELEEALRIVGVTDHVFLGGAGRYHDSGMTSDETGRAGVPDQMADNAFWKADLLETANHLVEIIRTRRPQVAITYDPHGNYGHPDHIMAHRSLMYAVQLAATPSHRPDLGAPWQVTRVLWNTHNTGLWAEAYRIARERGLELWPGADDTQAEERFGPDPTQIVAVVETGRGWRSAAAPWARTAAKSIRSTRSGSSSRSCRSFPARARPTCWEPASPSLGATTSPATSSRELT